MIPHNKPDVRPEDRAAVARALTSIQLVDGPEIRGLEAEVTALYGEGGACAVSSGTAALFLALRCLGVRRHDPVAVPTYACPAVLNAVLMAGARPLVADVREDDFTLDPDALRRAAGGRPPAATIAIHTFGAAADVPALAEAGGAVIEDCAHSLGGAVGGRPLGGDGAAAIFSFYATKVITCGHGGMLYDRTGRVAEAARDYRQFDGRETYAERFNVHLTEFQAAMARSQLGRLAQIAARRRAIARQYLELLPAGVRVQAGIMEEGRTIYRFVLRAPNRAARDALLQHFSDHGVRCIVPVKRVELLHRCLGLDPGTFPRAERLADTTVSLPLYPALTDAEVAAVCAVLRTARVEPP